MKAKTTDNMRKKHFLFNEQYLLAATLAGLIVSIIILSLVVFA